MAIEREFRLSTLQAGNIPASGIFAELSQRLMQQVEHQNTNNWELVTKDNYEGIRLLVDDKGSFFMIRPSLHDPVLSLQMECESIQQARTDIIQPLLEVILNDEDDNNTKLSSLIDVSPLQEYLLTTSKTI